MKWTATSDLDDLQNRFADQLQIHPMQEWSPELLVAAIALLDVHFAAGRTINAVVLDSPHANVVPIGRNRSGPTRV